MANDQIKNIAASVRARLLTMAKQSNRNFDAVLLQYVQERFLYRLSISPFRRNLVLKGALLFVAYDMSLLRPTKDIDFLGTATQNDLEDISRMVEAIARIEVADGVLFDPETVTAERIKEDADYEGVRVKIEARLTAARKILQLDVGFGDVVVAGPLAMDFPVLLDDQPVPNLLIYSKESAIAEKFEAMVALNLVTSRMKDIYDILHLAEREPFAMATLRQAVAATFTRRETPLADRAVLFSPEFTENRDKQTQWKAFQGRIRQEPIPLTEAMQRLAEFIEPVCDSTEDETGTWQPQEWRWV